ncbi:MAG: DUF1573 domain-containing protein [Paramuribaculum sp.]|nr:DUF1573 domain-containing protein [Paramuribaculum sp.]
MRLSSVIMLICLVIAAASCSGRVDKEKEVLSSLLGREIVIPDSLVCRILDTPIDYDMSNADYKIITYLDSAGCVPCRMKLPAWNSVINDLMTCDDKEVAFLMILNTRDYDEIGYKIKQDYFRHAVMQDNEGTFMKVNDLPAGEAYHTLLLDLNDKVIAVGNPAVNPKIREVYRRIITGDNATDSPHLCEQPVEALGVIHAGDTITRRFTLHNSTDSTLTIQEIVPSCDCVSAVSSSTVIPPDSTSVITMTLAVDSIPGSTRRYVDVYYNEKDNPERIALHGYIVNPI